MGAMVFELAGGPEDPPPWYKVWVPNDLVKEGLKQWPCTMYGASKFLMKWKDSPLEG